MRLYKMEFFKLFQNKIFKIGMLATTGLLFLYFWFAEVGGEIATVDGKFYSGYEAVQMNRKITEEFEGDLTDEKVNQIIEKYGLPTKFEENMPGWRDGNFLNDFVSSIVIRDSRFVNEFHILKATCKFCTRLSTFVMTFPFFPLLL